MKKILLVILFYNAAMFSVIAQNNIVVHQTYVICQGDSIFLQGAYRKVANSYYDTLKTSSNEDSIIATTLSINPTYFTQTSARICGYDSILIGSNYVKTAGIYYDSLKSSSGCDSIVEVTVNDSSIKVGWLGKFGPYGLQSNIPGDKYVWLDCNNNYAVISGLSGQTVLNLKNGSYAVEVTRNGCIDTSDCSSINVSLSELLFINNISVYPNPASSKITLDLGREYGRVSVEIITLTGQVFKSATFDNQKVVSLNTQQLAEGIYLLRVNADGKRAIKRITIHN